MTQPFIELHGITRWYGQQQALQDVTLTLEHGRIGLLGSQGAGKSTLLKILLGLMPPSSGIGTVLGEPLLPPQENLSFLDKIWDAITGATSEIFGQGSLLRRGIGYMPERDGLISGMQGAEYVALAGELDGMARKQARRRAHELLTCLGLEDARYRLIDEYSLGMKQRLRLAQALVHDPPVLLLDEPTSGLDPAGRDTMLDLLLALNQDHDKTILLCTHLLGDVERVCDTVVILHQGTVLRHGKVDDLCHSHHDRYRLQVDGDPSEFIAELQLEEVDILHNNNQGELRVRVPDGWVTRLFFTHADNNHVALRGLQRDDETLEELFHRVLDEQERKEHSL